MQRKQHRFTEESTARETKEKTKAKEMVPPPSGPNSINPGRWVTEANLITAGTQGEARDTVLAIIESYKPGMRYRQTRTPVAGQTWESEQTSETFIDLGQDVETRSLCYAKVPNFGRKTFCYQFHDTEGITPDSDAPSFPMVDQPNVLSGPALQDYRAHVRAQFPNFYKAKPKRKKRKQAAPVLRSVPMAAVVTRFEAWFAFPSEESERLFWEDLHALLLRRVERDNSADGKRLRLSGRHEELLGDFLAYLAGLFRRKLTNGERIESFEHYLNRAWRFRRIDALKGATEYERLHPLAGDFTGPEREGDSDFYIGDGFVFNQGAIQNRDAEPVRPSEEEVVQRWQGKLETLDPELADLVGFKLAGLTDLEAGRRMNLSRQAVVRLKGRIRAEVAA